MAYTDRQLLKMQQAGALGTTGASTPIAEIGRAHSFPHSVPKSGTENAATNVAETPLCTVNFKGFVGTGGVGTIKFMTNATATQDTSNYAVITVLKRTAGGAAVTVASWNTHNSAQGTITAWTPATLVAATANSGADATIAAGDALSYTITKAASGVQIQPGVFTIQPECV